MTLKVLLTLEFGVELPISGGNGDSLETPIVMHRTEDNDFVEMEYFIVDCLCKIRKIEYRLLGQEFSYTQKIDSIKIETKQKIGNKTIKQIEHIYFDISECFGKKV